MHCPYMSSAELVWLYRFYPKILAEWIKLEKAKIKKWRALGLPNNKNLDVFGNKLIPETLDNALKLFGHLTDEQLHKMSHEGV